MTGPFETEQQARELPAVRAVYAAFDADPGPGKMAPHNRRMLGRACEAAGLVMGRYDDRVIEWLSGWEPQVCAVVAGLITRAAIAAGAAGGPGEAQIRHAVSDPVPCAAAEDSRRLAAIRALLSRFNWQCDDRQYALEKIERIVNGDEG